MRISDWSSDVCSSDLRPVRHLDGQLLDVLVPPDALLAQIVVVVARLAPAPLAAAVGREVDGKADLGGGEARGIEREVGQLERRGHGGVEGQRAVEDRLAVGGGADREVGRAAVDLDPGRSEEHTYELQSLMRNSYAVFCL